MTTKLLVIDGHSMAFRAFYALPVDRFVTSGGQHTNAVYGFLSMLVKLLDTDQPTHIAVAFDESRVSFRTELFPEYKGTRDSAPPEFAGQVELIREVLDAMGIKQTQVVNYEADDIIATLATEGVDEGYEVLVASGDRDTFQLVNDQTTVIYPGRSTSDLVYMTPARIEEKYGLPPAQYPEIAALVGETSDNLPGVPGVGAKTAAQWLAKFGGLDALLENAERVTGKRGEALREHLEEVKMNRRLNHLLTDMDLPFGPDDCVAERPDLMELQVLFDSLEFGSLQGRILKAMGPLWGDERQGPIEQTKEVEESSTEKEKERILVDPKTDLSRYLGRFVAEDGDSIPVALWGEGRLSTTDADLTGLALTSGPLTIVLDPAELSDEQGEAVAIFVATHSNLIVHGGKSLAHAMATRGWELATPSFDTELAAYLARPGLRSYDLAVVARQILRREVSGEDDGALLAIEDLEGAEDSFGGPPARMAENARTVMDLVAPLRKFLAEHDQLSLLSELEIPVSGVLFEMERIGIAIDLPQLRGLRDEYAAETQRAAQDAYDAIGHETALGSPKQLQVVLFEELSMPKTRKTKTGYTTDAEALQELFIKTEHPFLEALLRHRDRTKLVQMIDSLLSVVQPDGRIHTTFSQTASVTGRLASSDPNLQNIPARSEAGIRIREAFVAGPGFENLMSVDYSQIEMRIMAHLSKDKDLIEAFNSGEDLHRTMASQVFGVPISEVTPELRNRIKATSYGLAYGLSPYGLSRQLGVSVEEATHLHHQYFDRFGGIGRYLHEVVEEAAQTGYTETMLGRRRYFPELRSDVRRVRENAERAALNAPIQGSAADIIKLAMIDVARRLHDGGYQSRMLLQVHDELVLEIASGESDEVANLVEEAMGNAVKLSVPLDVAVGEGHSWRDAAH
ncbi:DNA polymerase I [Actinomycetaceae bacterium MB13-C1-2]|nr:DNA polymerase I [Actinomycetaceae bacterium MB13-C1-2]